MTNYEKIKSMSVEEMAEFMRRINHIYACDECVAYGSCPMTYGVSCKRFIAEWLESEAEEDG